MLLPKIDNWVQALQHITWFLSPENYAIPYYLSVMNECFHDPFHVIPTTTLCLDEIVVKSTWKFSSIFAAQFNITIA